MPHVQFPTTYVYWEKLKKHDELKRKYMPIIDKIEQTHPNDLTNPFYACNIKSVSIIHRGLNTFLENEDINTIIWNPINNFIKDINSHYQSKIDVKESILDNYWFCTYDENDNQELHDHYDHVKYIDGIEYHTTFSGIYILNDDNESSSIVFRSPLHQPFYKLKAHHHLDTGTIDDIGEGTVLIFPSQLSHMVRQCKKPGRRTIAFNIFSSLPCLINHDRM
jgi:hypothetical protein